MKIQNDEIINDVKRVQYDIGKLPNSVDYIKYGKYGISTVKRRFGTWNNLSTKAFEQVSRRTRSRGIECTKTCIHCGDMFITKNTARKFCSQSCSCTYRNLNHTRKKKSTICIDCGSETDLYRNGHVVIRCVDCDLIYTKDTISDKTLGCIVDKYSGKAASTYSQIRENARICMVRRSVDKICAICGYDKHVECCHKFEISSYDHNTTIREINSEANLVYLCRNCHWESHNDYIDIHKL